MPRIRTIKPDFFRHEELQDLEAANPGQYVMLVFAGLWGHCDKGGVFEWKPRTLKLDILPFLDFDLAETLALLAQAGLVTRYAVDGKEYGFVPTFTEHQRIGGKEAQEPVKHPRSNGEATGKQRGLQEGKGREGKGTGKEGEGIGKGKVRAVARDDDPSAEGLDMQAWKRWIDYRTQIRKPLKPVSFPAAQRELAAFGCDQAAVVEQSIAQGWQGLFALKTPAKGATFHGKPAEPPRIPTAEQRAASERKAIEASARANGINPAGLTESQINDAIWRKRNPQAATA